MKELEQLRSFIESKNLKQTKQRERILEVFLQVEEHITIEELWLKVKKEYPSTGLVTVYRALKMFCESGLCREFRFEDGITRYEHHYNHSHHDHIICTECGVCVEVVDDTIEKLQEQLMKQYDFVARYHRMDLYGVCKTCRNKVN